ncbi:hypothetical protein GCM10028790_06450 [Micromonospora taraxaci]
MAQPFVQVKRAAGRTGVGGGITFEDGDGVTVAVQDSGEGKAARAAANDGDTLSHVDTPYRAIRCLATERV